MAIMGGTVQKQILDCRYILVRVSGVVGPDPAAEGMGAGGLVTDRFRQE